LSTPGTSQTGTNPEQLFAAGWSACFLSAVKLVADFPTRSDHWACRLAKTTGKSVVRALR
jgi:organic hydroperoxide reductase OsmC/OhrA